MSDFFGFSHGNIAVSFKIYEFSDPELEGKVNEDEQRASGRELKCGLLPLLLVLVYGQHRFCPIPVVCAF